MDSVVIKFLDNTIKLIVGYSLHADLHEGAHLVAAHLLGVKAWREDKTTVRLSECNNGFWKSVIIGLAPAFFGLLIANAIGAVWILIVEGWIEFVVVPIQVLFWLAWGVVGCSNDVMDVVGLFEKRFCDHRIQE